MIDRLRRISYFCAYAVATIPLWHYIRDGRILTVMIAVVAFAYVVVVLSSVQVAQPILSSEKAKTTLPRWLPDKPKYHKWWLIVRRTLKWQLLLVPPKMGLAYGFMQWFVMDGFPAYSVWHQIYYVWGYWGKSYPQFETILIALVLIVIFTIFETSLVSAILQLTVSSSLKKRFLFATVIRISLIIFAIFTLSNVGRFFEPPVPSYSLICQTYRYKNHQPELRRLYQNYCIRRRILETTYLAFVTPLDQSILLSANIMRPLKQSPYNENFLWTDNRPFVARQIVAGLLGLILYVGATWVILWFVEDEVQS